MTIAEKASRSIAIGKKLLREKPVNSTLTERAFLLDEAWKHVENEPQPLQMGKGIYEVLSRASLPIAEYDLLLGRYIDKVPTEEEEKRFWEIWQSGRGEDNPITHYNDGHITLDWARLCRDGVAGMLRFAEERLEKAQKDGEDAGIIQRLTGMQWVYRAILLYIERYGKVAEEAGLADCAAVCRSLTKGAPKTFREALQLELFVFTVYIIYAGRRVACLSFGRMDDDLLELYQNDLAAGRMTREEAGYYIDDFSAKCSLHLARGEHQMANPAFGGNTTGWERNAGFDSPTYIELGGYSNTHDHVTNPLTQLFVEHIHPGLKNPVIVYRHTSKTDPAQFRLLCDKIRQNASVLVYNDEVIIPAYRHIGIPEEDARNYSIHPCNWADIGGGYAIVDTVGGLMPAMLLELLNKRTDFTSMDELYAALAEQYRASIQPHFASYRARFRSGPIPCNGVLDMTDCFYFDTLNTGRNRYDGGVKYPAIWNLVRNVGTAADMLAAIDTLVFKDHVCTLSELMQACADDFAGAEDLLLRCKKAPKYGRDDERADSHARRVMNTLLDVADEESMNEKGERDVVVLNVTITDMWHIGEGARMQATPDGRRKGAPLSENLSPTAGSTESVTALLNTVSSLPFGRMHSGALNLRLRQDAVRGKAGLERLAVLMETYFERGGMQLQISIADTEQLREAQKCPECYGDLVVRITGYSAIFVDMSKNAQDELIRRDELS